jgi:hypothetical protein
LDGWGSRRRRGKLNLVNSETLTLALSPSPSCLLALEYIHKLPLTLLYYSYSLAQETRLYRRRRPGLFQRSKRPKASQEPNNLGVG